MKKPANSQRLGVGVDVECCEVAEQVRRVAGVGGHDVEPDHRRRACTRPPASWKIRNFTAAWPAALAAEAADQEVRRDQRGLEHHVEEEHVGRGEDAERQRPRAPASRRRTPWCCAWSASCHDATITTGHEHGGEQHQQQAEAVDAERVVGAERLDPVVGLGELEAAAGVVLRRPSRPRARSVSSEKPSAICLGSACRPRGQEQPSTTAPTSGTTIRSGQPGEVVHARFTASSARTTRSAPPSSERA